MIRFLFLALGFATFAGGAASAADLGRTLDRDLQYLQGSLSTKYEPQAKPYNTEDLQARYDPATNKLACIDLLGGWKGGQTERGGFVMVSPSGSYIGFRGDPYICTYAAADGATRSGDSGFSFFGRRDSLVGLRRDDYGSFRRPVEFFVLDSGTFLIAKAVDGKGPSDTFGYIDEIIVFDAYESIRITGLYYNEGKARATRNPDGIAVINTLTSGKLYGGAVSLSPSDRLYWDNDAHFVDSNGQYPSATPGAMNPTLQPPKLAQNDVLATFQLDSFRLRVSPAVFKLRGIGEDAFRESWLRERVVAAEGNDLPEVRTQAETVLADLNRQINGHIAQIEQKLDDAAVRLVQGAR